VVLVRGLGRSISNFSDIHLRINECYAQMQFSGPNGQVMMVPRSTRLDKTGVAFESLDQFDTSKVERLKIDFALPSEPLYRVLLPMEHLRVLTLYRCANPHIFIQALHPTTCSSENVVCPELEELIIVLNGGTLDMKSVIGVAAARASRGAKLKSVRIIGRDQPTRAVSDAMVV
jgi:hypothetical protein